MEPDFWHQAWSRSNVPGWQQENFNPYLTSHWDRDEAEVVFVPFCGRSLDLQWLSDRGHHVVGIDLSVMAIQKFCKQQSIETVCERDGELTVFRAPGWTLYAGDFFRLSASHLTRVSAVYDRAALVALPELMRRKYVGHMQSILPGGAEIFLITMAYDQGLMKGPPFSVSDAEVQELYRGYSTRILQSDSGPEQVGNLKERGLDTVTETCVLLQPQVDQET